MTIYLYVKQHSVTGLKYFGKTANNPYSYLGSGTYWTRHIKKHGKSGVQTLKVYAFEDQEEATKFAIEFSEKNNIVKSEEWANLMEENALTGFPSGDGFPEAARKSASVRGRKASTKKRLWYKNQRKEIRDLLAKI